MDVVFDLRNERHMALGFPHSENRPVRVLRWTYRRGNEDLLCELGLTTDDSAYELRLAPPSIPGGETTELFNNVVSAFERLAVVERRLIDAGWSLESFESQHIARPAPQNEIAALTGQ